MIPQSTTIHGTQEPPWQEFPESPHGVGEQREGKGEQLKEGIRKAGADTARRAREQGEAFLGEQKHTVAESIHHCGEALKGAAQQFREKQDPNLASFAETVANQMERVSGYLDGKNLQDIRNDLESFAHRQPAAFYGGMFVAGLALSRFFKASQANESEFERGRPGFAPESSESPENMSMNPI
jgi:gas vesicle protein